MSDINDRQQKVIKQELKRGGLRGRINAMCASCIYDSFGDSGTWRQQVERCTSFICPLYDVRPISNQSVVVPKRGKQQPKTRDYGYG